eukprot:TRINITY_DN41736_c0_g2_i1.p1 TRINITY_DN41736_c0_g2~~TRINITY_DN41736_c0_g2_i1.p1  ORF type:complete len:2428 (-),score=443.19 TRINITY_DN41736_c0_g2_i1:71-7354(-)
MEKRQPLGERGHGFSWQFRLLHSPLAFSAFLSCTALLTGGDVTVATAGPAGSHGGAESQRRIMRRDASPHRSAQAGEVHAHDVVHEAHVNAFGRASLLSEHDRGSQSQSHRKPKVDTMLVLTPEEHRKEVEAQASRHNVQVVEATEEGEAEEEPAAANASDEKALRRSERLHDAALGNSRSQSRRTSSGNGMVQVAWVSPGELTKSIVASSVLDEKHGPDKALRDDTRSWWSSTGNKASLTFELLRKERLTGFRVRQPEGVAGGSFRDWVVSRSASGWAWVEVARGRGREQACCEFQTFEFQPFSSPYWKLDLMNPWGVGANVTLSYIEFKLSAGESEGFDIPKLAKCQFEGSYTYHEKCSNQEEARKACQLSGMRLCSMYEIEDNIGRVCHFMWTTTSAKLGYHVGSGRQGCGTQEGKIYASEKTNSGVGMFDAACCKIPVTTSTTTLLGGGAEGELVVHEEFGTYHRTRAKGGCATNTESYPESQIIRKIETAEACRKLCDKQPSCGAMSWCGGGASCATNCYIYANERKYTMGNGAEGRVCWIRKGKLIRDGQASQATVAWRSPKTLVQLIRSAPDADGQAYQASQVLKDDTLYWKSSEPKAQLKFEMIGAMKISGMAVKVPADLPGSSMKDFFIEISEDGEQWRVIKKAVHENQFCCEFVYIEWTPTTSPHWRLNILSNYGAQFVAIQYLEFRVTTTQASCSYFVPSLQLDHGEAKDFVHLANVGLQASGGVPFGSGSIASGCGDGGPGTGIPREVSGKHCWHNINDGKVGESSSWMPGSSFNGLHFVGVQLGNYKQVHGIRLSTPVTHGKHVGGWYHVQYTGLPVASHRTPDSMWCTIGSFTRSKAGYLYKKFTAPVNATAIRILVTDQTALLDELAVYGETESLPVTDGLVTDLRAEAYMPGMSLWANQVSGSSEQRGWIPRAVTFNEEHKAFHFARGGPVIKVPLMSDALAMPECTYTAWVRLFKDESQSCASTLAGRPSIDDREAGAEETAATEVVPLLLDVTDDSAASSEERPRKDSDIQGDVNAASETDDEGGTILLEKGLRPKPEGATAEDYAREQMSKTGSEVAVESTTGAPDDDGPSADENADGALSDQDFEALASEAANAIAVTGGSAMAMYKTAFEAAKKAGASIKRAESAAKYAFQRAQTQQLMRQTEANASAATAASRLNRVFLNTYTSRGKICADDGTEEGSCRLRKNGHANCRTTAGDVDYCVCRGETSAGLYCDAAMGDLGQCGKHGGEYTWCLSGDGQRDYCVMRKGFIKELFVTLKVRGMDYGALMDSVLVHDSFKSAIKTSIVDISNRHIFPNDVSITLSDAGLDMTSLNISIVPGGGVSGYAVQLMIKDMEELRKAFQDSTMSTLGVLTVASPDAKVDIEDIGLKSATGNGEEQADVLARQLAEARELAYLASLPPMSTLNVEFTIENLAFSKLAQLHKDQLMKLVGKQLASAGSVDEKNVVVALNEAPALDNTKVVAKVKVDKTKDKVVQKALMANSAATTSFVITRTESIDGIDVAKAGSGPVGASAPVVLILPDCADKDRGRALVVAQDPDFGASRALVISDWNGSVSINAGVAFNSSLGKAPVGDWFFLVGTWRQNRDSYVYMNGVRTEESVQAKNSAAGAYNIVFHKSKRCLGIKDQKVVFQKECKATTEDVAIEWLPGNAGSSIMRFKNGKCARTCSGSECDKREARGSTPEASDDTSVGEAANASNSSKDSNTTNASEIANGTGEANATNSSELSNISTATAADTTRNSTTTDVEQPIEKVKPKDVFVILDDCDVENAAFQFRHWVTHEGYFQLRQRTKQGAYHECVRPIGDSRGDGAELVLGDCAVEDATIFYEKPRASFEYLSIGGLGDDTTHNAEMLISDVAVYNRSLTADEIAKLYSYGRPSLPATVVGHCPASASGQCVPSEYREYCEYLAMEVEETCNEFCERHEGSKCVRQFAALGGTCSRGTEGSCELSRKGHICRCMPPSTKTATTTGFNTDVIAVGRDRIVYKQPLPSMSEASDWQQLAPCCVLSVAATRNVLYGVSGEHQIVKITTADLGVDAKWKAAGKGDMVAIAVRGGDIYGVGTDKKIYKQALSTMTLGSDWQEAGRCCATSIAFADDFVFVTGEDGQVYRQTMDGMAQAGRWVLAGKGGIVGLMAIGSTLYAAGADNAVYRQELSTLNAVSDWEKTGKCCMRSLTSVASVETNGTSLISFTTKSYTTTWPTWERVELLKGSTGKRCSDTAGTGDVYEVKKGRALTEAECEAAAQRPPIESRWRPQDVRFYQFCSQCDGKSQSNCNLVKYCSEVDNDPAGNWRLFVNVNIVCPAMWLADRAGVRRMTRACDTENFVVADELHCQELAFKNRSKYYQYCENCEKQANWCCHQDEECACYTGTGWRWQAYMLSDIAGKDGKADPCFGYEYDLNGGPWKPEHGR